ncbi:uncharacterized protein [Typha angustifolia]|uniref:uncharacterized protein isoform X1 n=1 Tax=Typha angustifolia TaxID=59011 RepID=UPI003C2F2898
MASHYQAAPLVASPSYPNSISWSNENLVAIASGHLITILNPAFLVGPRGLITLHPNKPFPIGVVDREDLLGPYLMPTCLSRDVRPCVRSISWSQPGFAPNSGCLLAVCTTDGHVKLYRAPYCEFHAEWVEVADISILLYEHLQTTKFGELNASLALVPHKQVNADCIADISCNVLPDRAGHLAASGSNSSSNNIKVVDAGSSNLLVNGQRFSPISDGRSSKNRKNDVHPLITANQYASRSAVLSSLIVTWSPILPSHGRSPYVSNKCTILAVGAKSGDISFWRICTPQCYTIEHGRVPIDAMFVELLQAHNSWITAISWGISDASSSKPRLVLSTGSCDGSVKVWIGDIEGLIRSTRPSGMFFSLLFEVNTVTSSPVSTISMVIPVQVQDEVHLAIGRGSGSLETWKCNILSNNFQCVGIHDAHDQVVTGLAWAFDGRCLYSCSQDNSIHSWILHGIHVKEVPFPSSFPGLKNLTNLPQLSDQCFGLALAPGELMVAVVRSFDANLLNQMYQARTQKAVVEFFWTGGQLLEVPPEKNLTCGTVPSVLSERDFLCWESNILWSLKNYEDIDKMLVLWDVITALQAFKKSSTTFVENLLSKWISCWFSDDQPSVSVEKILLRVQSMLSKVCSRKIHLLNIICRRLMSTEMTAELHNWGQHNFNEINNNDKEIDSWNKYLVNSERKQQERLVALTFSTVLSRVACLSNEFSVDTCWFPVGVAQMEHWIVLNNEVVDNRLKVLRSEIRELGSRINSVCEYATNEICSFCSALVQFDSPDVAWCKGHEIENNTTQSHRLPRCAVSMRLCSISAPLWFCICCQRWIDKLAPLAFFTMSKSPLDVKDGNEYLNIHGPSLPLCPFCGIQLQRSMPEFLLSICPV